jgi:hypothetical protein
MIKHSLFVVFILLNVFCYAQTTMYVKPDAPSGGNGTLANPYNKIPSTVDMVEAAGGGEVIIINGEYHIGDSKITITTAATESTAVTIKPQSPAGVKLIFTGRKGFWFDASSRYITLRGLELYGLTDVLDYWTIVARGFWHDDSVLRNGGLAIVIDGQYITIKDNYIHDWYQKAIEISDGRYVVVEGNIIRDIAQTSLSGGHGIMRQQKGCEFSDDDIAGVYRWDIRENMIFKVEQRIYSWVPSKGFIEMVIDEGKSILIDEPNDTDGIQEHMSARITNNIVAFGSIDHIRIKNTPNLEVSHNSVYADVDKADAITDTNVDGTPARFTNFKCYNNATQSLATTFGVEIEDAVSQTASEGGTAEVYGNYAMDGKVGPTNQTGIIKLAGDQLFVDAAIGNFRINPALGLPSTTGVNSGVLDALDVKVTMYGVSFTRERFVVDHLKLSQTILDNVPGLNDGIEGNEIAFTDYGTMSPDYHTITFNVVEGDWKTKTGSSSTQEFRLNKVYRAWYSSIDSAYTNSSGAKYERIRWGNSEIMQNQVFDADWLTVCQIQAESNTLINGHENAFTLDGDILIDFENYEPQPGDEFDLIIANSITTNNTEGLFDRVLFEGFSPENYTLEVVNVDAGQAVRLSITSPVSINNFIANTIKVSPNPAQKWFDLYADFEVQNIQIFDLFGKELTKHCTITPRGYGYRVNTESLKSGMYILKADNKTIRVVIND